MHKTITVVFSMVLLITTLSVAQPPTITSFTPAGAPVGTRVTINGTNFNTVARKNIVYFGATRAKPVWVENSTQLSVLVPPGATYQPISVLDTTTMLAGYASKPFVVAFNLGTTQGIDGSSFETKVDFATGVKPESVAIGDLDGDGKSDLVVANSNSNTVSVYRNISSSGTITGASFAPKIDFTVGVTPLAVAIGDLDGNGRPEIAVVNYNQSSVSVLRNYSWAGNISFGARLNFAVGSIPYSIAIGDLDRDGNADLAVTNISSNTVSVLRNTTNQGALSFAARVTYATGEVPFSVAIGDLNGDAKPEMAVANYTSSTVSVFRNTASSGSITSASFAAKVDFAADAPHFVAMGDLDLDGRPDLALSGNNRVSILRNTTPSGNTTAISFAAKVDFTTGTSPYGVAIADLNGDGKPDLATVNSTSNTVSVLRNTSWVGNITTGSFSAKVDFNVGSTPFSLALGDLDMDGKPELVTANYASNTISVLRNTLSSGPSTPSNLTATAGIGQVTLRWKANTETIAYYRVYVGTTPNPADTVGKIIHPAAEKIITGLSSGTRYYFRIRAVDTFGNASALTEDVTAIAGYAPPIITSFTPGSGPLQTSVVITGTNFNPHSFNNIVTFGATEARVISGNANQLTVQVQPGATYQPITLTDTITDLTAYAAKPFGVTFGTGAGKLIDGTSFGSRVELQASSRPNSVAIGDLNSDGKPDLVVVNDTARTVSVYRNISSAGAVTAASFAAKVDFATGVTPFFVAIGDLDGDTWPDLVVTNYSSNTISVFKNISFRSFGDIIFAAGVEFAVGRSPYKIAIGDLDSDGKPDLAVTNVGDNTVSLLRNVISGYHFTTASFEPRVNFTTGSVPYSVAIADLNGDRRPDMAVTNRNSSTVSVYKNVTTDDSLAFVWENFATSSGPGSIAIGDLDSDGKPDLAVANTDSDTVSVLRNTTLPGGIAPLSFAAKVGFASGDRPVSIAIGNLNGDAKPDLAVVNLYDSTISVLRNIASTGSITTSSFAPRVDFSVAAFPQSVAVGDLDSDGKPELVAATFRNTISILHNNLDVTPPAVPKGLTASVSSSQILLKWIPNTERDLLYYKVYRGTKALPSTLLVTIHVPNIDLLDYGVNGTKYYYRISAVDSAGNESAKTADVTATPDDEKSEFRKKNTTEQEESYTEEVTIHPNPSAGPVQLTLPTADTAVISVLDLQERVIKQGQYNSTTVTLDLGDVAKGIYLIRIQQGDLVKTLRVIIY
jgi:hypothetical protein